MYSYVTSSCNLVATFRGIVSHFVQTGYVFFVPIQLMTLILTHLAYIANGKKRVILCNNFTGRISVTLLCGICDVSYPTKQR